MIGVGLMFAIGTIVFTVLIGHMIKWLLEWVLAKSLSEREAAIAAFAFAIGNSLGLLVFDYKFDFVSVATKVGLVIGLFALWWSFFRRRRAMA